MSQLLGHEDVARSLKLDERQRQAVIDLAFVAGTMHVFPGMLEGWERSERERRARCAAEGARNYGADGN